MNEAVRVFCRACNGKGKKTVGPYPATECSNCHGRGFYWQPRKDIDEFYA